MLPGLIAEAPTQGIPPVECGSPTRPFHHSLPLGTWHLNVWTAQEREGYGALFLALCLCVCAAELFDEACCNAATARTDWSSRTSRHTAEPHPDPQTSTGPTGPWRS
ncbi:hypothetical protein GCM10019016_081050 [Streptomyces prasinosporus]|uniref:Uncharacterized protein n=1 Tax=Streptomyces prasinosporus TaxID=68256 RepID=A0ABP6U2T7_9ACTN|nr:hypothetical protein GCM10010332_51270 [Streptomyces albogriseolus]